MTYILDETTDNRFYLHWNGEFVGFYKTIGAAFIDMNAHRERMRAEGMG